MHTEDAANRYCLEKLFNILGITLNECFAKSLMKKIDTTLLSICK